MSEIRLREATNTDIVALRQLEQELIEFKRPFDPFIRDADVIYYDLDSLVSSSNSTVFLAEINNKIVASGYGQIRESEPFIISDKHCYIGFIYVKPEFRGHGLSRRIVQTLTDWAKLQGVSHFLLDVYSDNSGAIRAYEKFGFKSRSVSMELML